MSKSTHGKIRNLSDIQQEIAFTEFDFYQQYVETFKTSELGRIKSLLPLREMAISFGLIEVNPKSLRTPRGRKPFFTPEGKVALAFLKMHTGLSAPKLLEALNGNIHYQIFCGVRINPRNHLTSYTIVLGAQDKSQLKRDYGEKESEVIFNTVGNIFSVQVNGKTAEELSKSFGKEFRKRESQTRGIEQDSVNISFQHEELLPLSTIETLSQGVFFGKVADNNDMKIKEKFFCGEIVRDLDELKRKRKRWRRLPKFTDFGEEEAMQSVYDDADKALLDHFMSGLMKGVVIYDKNDLTEEAERMCGGLTEEERSELLDRIAKERADKAVRDIIERNFRKVQADVKGIIDRECAQSQEISSPKPPDVDPRMVDSFHDF